MCLVFNFSSIELRTINSYRHPNLDSSAQNIAWIVCLFVWLSLYSLLFIFIKKTKYVPFQLWWVVYKTNAISVYIYDGGEDEIKEKMKKKESSQVAAIFLSLYIRMYERMNNAFNSLCTFPTHFNKSYAFNIIYKGTSNLYLYIDVNRYKDS